MKHKKCKDVKKQSGKLISDSLVGILKKDYDDKAIKEERLLKPQKK